MQIKASDNTWQRCNTHAFWQEEASCSHVLQIYENNDDLLNLLEGFANSGFSDGDAVVIIATPENLAALEKKLKQSGADLKALKTSGQYLPYNAEEVLPKFMVNNWPDYSLFMASISEIFAQAKTNNRNVRAFGEMVAVLWKQGNSGGTIMLEQLWNMFCEKEPISLFCAYPANSFENEPEVSLRNICKTHSKMVSSVPNSSKELSFQNIT